MTRRKQRSAYPAPVDLLEALYDPALEGARCVGHSPLWDAERTEERVYARARAAVIRRLEKGGVVSRKSIRTSMRSELKRHLDSTLEELISEGIVAERPGEYALAGGYGGTAGTPQENTR